MSRDALRRRRETPGKAVAANRGKSAQPRAWRACCVHRGCSTRRQPRKTAAGPERIVRNIFLKPGADCCQWLMVVYSHHPARCSIHVFPRGIHLWLIRKLASSRLTDSSARRLGRKRTAPRTLKQAHPVKRTPLPPALFALVSEFPFGCDAPNAIGLVIQNIAKVAVADSQCQVFVDDISGIQCPPVIFDANQVGRI